eukprot:COSAG01_NODE_39477_length_476_cov_0.514589_1_plen_42_part_10
MRCIRYEAGSMVMRYPGKKLPSSIARCESEYPLAAAMNGASE